jgi:hypothetical protein
MPLQLRKQATLSSLLLTLFCLLIMYRGANAGLLRGDVQQHMTASSQDGRGSNNDTSNNNNMMKSEKAARISMDLSKSWKSSSSLEVQIDAYGSIIADPTTGTTSGRASMGIGSNNGIFNSLVVGGASNNAFQQQKMMMTPMASLHVYIPKNGGNHEPLPKKDDGQQPKRSLWNVWSWWSS